MSVWFIIGFYVACTFIACETICMTIDLVNHRQESRDE